MDNRKIQNKEELRQQLKASRHAIGLRTDSLLNELDFVSKVKKSINGHPVLWGTGAFIGGMLLLKLLSPGKQHIVMGSAEVDRKFRKEKRKSLLGHVFSLSAGLVTPYAKDWATGIIKDHFSSYRNR